MENNIVDLDYEQEVKVKFEIMMNLRKLYEDAKLDLLETMMKDIGKVLIVNQKTI